MDPLLNFNPKLYYLAVIYSLLFTLLGFSYNVWRMEISEQNNTIRTASFEMLVELSSLEQLIYTAHYDGDLDEGSPRKGWVKVGLIAELSVLTDPSVELTADDLRKTWAENWDKVADNNDSVTQVVKAIDDVRSEIKRVLKSLE
ncbi:MAG: hypothetical protein P1P93_04870 [Gammaproteobacteria bacterium]|nr:hypothetical protein [Gammaproteobacteria bacterium]